MPVVMMVPIIHIVGTIMIMSIIFIIGIKITVNPAVTIPVIGPVTWRQTTRIITMRVIYTMIMIVPVAAAWARRLSMIIIGTIPTMGVITTAIIGWGLCVRLRLAVPRPITAVWRFIIWSGAPV